MVHKPRRNHDLLAEGEILHPVEVPLEQRVADLLAVSGSVDASAVTVTAEGDRIHLRGIVFSAEEIARSSAIALSVDGVQTVENDILLQDDHSAKAL
jgi:hypothetical protein